MKKIIGLTGNIGSGKSTVAYILELLGIPVYYADDRAKVLMTSSIELRHAISELLGSNAYLPDGTLNRRYIAAQIFSDDLLRQQLNQLVHPAVAKDVRQWAEQQSTPVVVQEAALLVENGAYRKLDGLVVVTAPEDVRLARVTRRDNSSGEKVRARMRAQLPEADKVAVADWVIDNGGQALLVPQVLRLYREWRTTTNTPCYTHNDVV